MKADYKDTIAAIATSPGEGGIGIVRLSGPKAIPIAAKIFRPKPHRDINALPSHTLHYGEVAENKKTIDTGLLAIMRAPHSYTREDVVELHVHGGVIPLQKILRLAINTGAKLAEPGEFTRRAFVNGRLDLAQAEAVVDLIRAKTEAFYTLAQRQFSGVLSRKINELREKLLKILTRIEANIDFAEESRVTLGQSFQKNLSGVIKEVRALAESAGKGRAIKEGVKAVIVGRTNVGKSSLMNALMKEERVIVTHIPGTTRDVIEERVEVGGVTLKFADTAGIRKARNPIEKQGVNRSRAYMEQADLIILVLDGSQPLKKIDREIIKTVVHHQKRAVVVINKIDLPLRINIERIKQFFPGGNIVKLSAKHQLGLSVFTQKLLQVLGLGSLKKAEGEVIVNCLRHQKVLEKAEALLKEALAASEQGFSSEYIAFGLWGAADTLGEILGLNYKENLLDAIFQEFCVGK